MEGERRWGVPRQGIEFPEDPQFSGAPYERRVSDEPRPRIWPSTHAVEETVSAPKRKQPWRVDTSGAKLASGRRSPRVVLRVPLEIKGPEAECAGSSAVVNRQGALIVCPVRYPAETVLEITDVRAAQSARFRVVRAGDEDFPGRFRLGVELLEEGPGFWGPEYDERVALERDDD